MAARKVNFFPPWKIIPVISYHNNLVPLSIFFLAEKTSKIILPKNEKEVSKVKDNLLRKGCLKPFSVLRLPRRSWSPEKEHGDWCPAFAVAAGEAATPLWPICHGWWSPTPNTPPSFLKKEMLICKEIYQEQPKSD